MEAGAQCTASLSGGADAFEHPFQHSPDSLEAMMEINVNGDHCPFRRASIRYIRRRVRFLIATLKHLCVQLHTSAMRSFFALAALAGTALAQTLLIKTPAAGSTVDASKPLFVDLQQEARTLAQFLASMIAHLAWFAAELRHP